ncbi:MAG: transcriptional regulator [Candidatus Magasanikbacteria bacterium CG11_big_fil_rev_8_21_14_0_20_39_34]|uniref:Transcriptional regulator n=1 Tax=Candidatus Magasanikbacteria bacterium CG11_big_fil_rev_8_21_14_0_20_39_34 TaxID=1974653 RepID=A0A2H0N898_9BACT|nr:MAG: transcriptional regulator [Candidatus Magasanikbacteria bacterium CG11_big_fil_rev_8_21_14_0_20_39_34]
MEANYLKKLGFSDKSVKIYLALLSLGPSSVRKLAEKTGINRGTTYDILKELLEHGVVSYAHKDTKQKFFAENPDKLHKIVESRRNDLERAEREIDKALPELQALYSKAGDRPIARYYTREQIQDILEDILEVCSESEEKMYRIYSTQGIREYIYEDFPTFSDVRVARGIEVKVIAIGDGGELRGLDQRKWMTEKNTEQGETTDGKPVETYIIMYPGKTAYISLNAQDEPVGVVIENEGVYQTQRNIFDNLWAKL